MNYEMVQWDSSFFEMPIARINISGLSQIKLISTLTELRAKKIKLVYLSSRQKLNETIVKSFGGSLVDNKITFYMDLRNLNLEKSASTHLVETYSQLMPITELESLAIQAGEYSRFSVDKNIPVSKFILLYKTWIRRSITKEIADEVLVIQKNKQIIGMITLNSEDKKGEISLLSVDKNHREKGFGKLLVRSAQFWFLEHGCEFGQVITQEKNTSACNLYKKCGYSLQKIEHFYHFWL